MVYTVLYTDYSTLEIHHRCEAHGINTQSGMCEEPLFFVNVRQKPNALSQETKSYIKNAVDYFLSPFCMSSRNLNFTPVIPVPRLIGLQPFKMFRETSNQVE
jgi:hypothetical protein